MKILIGAIVVVALGTGAWATAVWAGIWPWGVVSNVIKGHAKVLDGDTIDVDGTRVRLEGIDAPETDQKCRDKSNRDYLCGVAAAKALRDLIGRGPVTCKRIGKDGYGRVLGICSNANGVDMNAELVRRGLAVAFRRYSMRYAYLEDAARAIKAELWSGTFEHPGCFRAARNGRQCKDTVPTS